MSRLGIATGEDIGGDNVSSRFMDAYSSGQAQQEDVMARKHAGIAEADARRAQIMAAGKEKQEPAAKEEPQSGQAPNIDVDKVMGMINQFSKKGQK